MSVWSHQTLESHEISKAESSRRHRSASYDPNRSAQFGLGAGAALSGVAGVGAIRSGHQEMKRDLEHRVAQAEAKAKHLKSAKKPLVDLVRANGMRVTPHAAGRFTAGAGLLGLGGYAWHRSRNRDRW